MKLWGVILILVGLSSCSADNPTAKSIELSVPKGFSIPIIPEQNPITSEKIALGKKLFFDSRLSKNNNISCGTCHLPEFAFSDTVAVSVGTNGELGFRNTPSLINIAYKTLFHMDGGVRTLELQTLAPIIDTNELGGDFSKILNTLNTDTFYLKLFKNAFDTLPSVYGITRALASYERSLIGGNSNYDFYRNGNLEALSESQLRGLALFNSNRLNCNSCHSGVLFTNYTYQNVGMEEQFSDSGRARITYLHDDAGKFVVPSLRNIARTAPYMHNGSIANLTEVITYFERGGGNHWNKSKLIKSFTLSVSEREDLIHFLESLSDTISITY